MDSEVRCNISYIPTPTINSWESNFSFKSPTIVTSKYTDPETNNFIDNILEKNVIKVSSSLKFCYLAEGFKYFLTIVQ